MKTNKEMSFLNTYSIALRFTMLLLFIVSFEKIGIAQNPLLCSNATDFLATNDSLPVYEQQTDSSKWYKFIAETNELELDVYAINSSSLNNFTQLILWEGNCNSLNQLAINSIENSADDVMSLSVNNLIIGNNYFVEILKPNNNAILNYSVALHFFSLNAVCTGNFGPPCEFVADGSFEKFIALPQMQDRLSRTCNWKKPTFGTSDYFNAGCYYLVPGTTNVGVDVPQNMVGIQNSMTPLAGIDQNGYAGFFAHIPNYQLNSGPTDIVPHLHEYVAQELIKPLIPGVTYQISFWVSLADRSTIAANDIGMYLSKTAPYYNNYSLLAMNAGNSFLTGGTPVVPQISQRYMPTIGSSFISDKINWVQITGTIVGNGEKWISIGNFGNTVSQPIFNGNIPSGFTALPDPYYYLDNVSIEAISFPITPPTANVCLHGQINLTTQNNLTASWGYTSGSAASFSCNPCSSPTVTVNGASNINAYYHFNGPLYSINNICYLVSNTVTPTIGTISLSATANPQNIPVGGTSNLSVNYLPINFVGIPQYSWTPTTNLNAVAISNPQASPLVSTIYTATVSNANGCSGTTSVLVNVIAPQCDNSLTYAYKTALGSDFSSNVFGTSTIINGANIEVNGLLKVDRSITFNNCNFKMAANSKIIIENSKTFFLGEKNHLFSCTNMWDGIYIDGSSKGYLIISGSTLIEDALNAVVSNSGGGFDIHHAIFNRNLQAIVINNSNNTSTPGTIKHSIFTSRVLQHFSNPSNYANIDVLALTLNSLPSAHLIYPNDAPRSAFGIKTSNSKYIEIGDQYDQGFSNLFDNVACGIFIDKSNAFITNNTFQNISLPPIKSNCVNCPAQYSTAIKAVGDYSTGNFSIWLGDNGSNFHLNNHFTNIYRAIDIEGFKTIDIRGNEIHNSNTVNQPSNSGMGASGIYIKSPSANNHIKIWECIVNNCYDAIKVDRDYSISLKNSEIDISTNLIDATGSGQCRFGIKVADLTAQWIILTSTTNIDITNNTITNAYNCISADNIKTRLNIQSNSAAIRNNSSSIIQKRGIALSSCWNAVVSDNCNIIGLPSSIDYSSAAYSTEDIRGIYIYNSPGIQIIRNSIKNTSKALMLDGNCAPTGSNFTRVASNNFIKSYYGLYMNNSPNIGAQGNPNPSYNFATGTNTPDVSENKWLGTFNKKTFVANCGINDQNVLSKFYLRDDLLGLASETFPSSSFNGQSASIAYNQNSGLTPIPLAIEDWAFSGPNQCGLTFPSPILVSEEPDNVAPSTEEKIETLEIINETPDPITDIEQGINWEKQKFAYTVLDQNPEIIQESMVLNDFYYFNESQAIGDLNYVDKAIEQQSFLLAKNINNNVVTSKTIELNQKIMNDLILKREENSSYVFNQIEVDNLYATAAQCIYTGGNAVLQARILVGILLGNTLSFYDDCTPTVAARYLKTGNESNLSKHYFFLSPNPSSGELKLKYKLNKSDVARLTIYSSDGKQQVSIELNSENYELILEKLNLSSGIYSYQIKVNELLVKSDKLVILN